MSTFKKKDLNKKKVHNKMMDNTTPSVLHLTPERDGVVCEVDLFNDLGLDLAIKKLKWSIKEGFLVDKGGNRILCGICREGITPKKLSAFFPGSVKAVCEKPGCFMVAIYKSEKTREG